MKNLLIGLFIGAFSLSASASFGNFSCQYSDVYKVKSKWKLKKKPAVSHDRVVTVKGSLGAEKGSVSIQSDYLFGTSVKQQIKLYRAMRDNENDLAFAKFHNKTAEQVKSNQWVSQYIRFSLPKEREHKDFVAYLGYFKAVEGNDESASAAVILESKEKASFASLNERQEEYKLLCVKK